MLKLGENLSWDFEVIYIFRKNAVLDICQYLKGFYEQLHANIDQSAARLKKEKSLCFGILIDFSKCTNAM